jgi:hypothetical protein
MANLEAVYRYGSIDGEIVAQHEIESLADLPSVDETIPLPDKNSERRFVVMARFQPTTASWGGEATRSAFTIVVKDAK